MKTCHWCGKEKELEEFARNVRASDGRQANCRECLAKNWRLRHRIADFEPLRRTSPYDRIAIALDKLEGIVMESHSAAEVLLGIDQIRADLKLTIKEAA